MRINSRVIPLSILFGFGLNACTSMSKETSGVALTQNSSAHRYSDWTLREKIGQLLIIGYRDNEQIGDVMPGGVALFSWSMKSVEQTRQLTQEIQNIGHQKLKAPLLIATDHEGGRVIRLRRGMTLFPEASAVGLANDPKLSKRVGHAVGEELAYLGINANFAPVLDMGGAESFLGNRIWGENPEQVSQMTGAYIEGLQETGVMSVAKHFPGHGASADDAHFGAPVNRKNLQTLWSEDFYPFRHAVMEQVPAMMTAHVRVPEVDRLPASMSPRFLSRILRDTFKFDGVIITDDLEMKGAQDNLLSVGDLALQALIAGSDMILIVWSKSDQKQIIARIEKAIRVGEWSESELDRKLDRILTMKSKWVENSKWQKNHVLQDSPMRSKAHLELASEIESVPVQWRGPKSAALREELRSRWSSKWRVGLPSLAYARYWKSWRPQDDVTVLEKRMGSQALKDASAQFSPMACTSTPCVMVTEAANQSSEDLYKHMQWAVGPESVDKNLRAPTAVAVTNGGMIWAHMGLEPALESINSRSAIVLLGSSGLARLQRFSDDLTPAKSNSSAGAR